MNPKPIDLLLSVAAIGGRLGAAGDKLRMLLPPSCPPELKSALRAQKVGLLTLLQSNFLVIHSAALKANVFWTPDQATKELLVAAGADAGDVFTAAELNHLVDHRITAAELPLIHATRRQFLGTLREPGTGTERGG